MRTRRVLSSLAVVAICVLPSVATTAQPNELPSGLCDGCEVTSAVVRNFPHLGRTVRVFKTVDGKGKYAEIGIDEGGVAVDLADLALAGASAAAGLAVLAF